MCQENIRIDEVKLRRKYINSGDVFILDLGLKIIQVCLLTAYIQCHTTGVLVLLMATHLSPTVYVPYYTLHTFYLRV